MVSLSISVSSSFSWFFILEEGISIIERLNASNDKALFQLFNSLPIWLITIVSEIESGALNPRATFLRLFDCSDEVIPRHKEKIAIPKNPIGLNSISLRPCNTLNKAMVLPIPITSISVSVCFSVFFLYFSLKYFNFFLYINSPDL